MTDTTRELQNALQEEITRWPLDREQAEFLKHVPEVATAEQASRLLASLRALRADIKKLARDLRRHYNAQKIKPKRK